MSLGNNIHIMMFYGRSENVNLTYSIKVITIIFLYFQSIVLAYHQEAKTIEFIQCLINFEETFNRRPNCVPK